MLESKVVAVTATIGSALESVAGICPDLVLLQTHGLDAGYLARVHALRVSCPQTRIVALVEDPNEGRVFEKGAVDGALVRGSRPSKLTETISELLSSPATTMART
jgi:hypothetical protein